MILAQRADGYVFPVLYALLMNKSQTTYQRLFDMIKQLWPAFSPTSISVDFEKASINALQICFPEADVWGCFFHLGENLKKQLSNHGLKARYENDTDFRIKCRKFFIDIFMWIVY